MACAALLITGCQQSIPKEALQLSAEALETRQLQTRRYETKDEKLILSASAQVLQDLGYNLEESETELGVIVSSKERDATETGQVVGAVVVAALFGVVPQIDKNQKIRASLVTRPHGEEGNQTAVRITFQRIVWNTRNEISKLETLDDPKLYQEFFEKLSKAIFLEGYQI